MEELEGLCLNYVFNRDTPDIRHFISSTLPDIKLCLARYSDRYPDGKFWQMSNLLSSLAVYPASVPAPGPDNKLIPNI